MKTKYRVRIVFNGPVDREHSFVSLAKDTLEEANQILDDMRPACVHAVSVTVQQAAEEDQGRVLIWKTMSSLEPGKLRD